MINLRTDIDTRLRLILKDGGAPTYKRGLTSGPHGLAGPTQALLGPIFDDLSWMVDWRSSKSVSSLMIVICSDE